LNINDLSYTVVGVMPASFQYPDDAEMWAPLAIAPSDLGPNNRGNHGLQVLARIKPELSLAQARQDMSAVTRTVEEQNPDYPYAKFRFAFTLTRLLDEMVSDIQMALWILTGAVGLVLLIACANVANLLLVRASNREREIAIRMALGAGRRRVIGQLLTESLLLAILGGAAGILLAGWGLRVLIEISASVFPRVAAASLDGRVLLFTTLISVGTGVLFGLAPALQSTRGINADSLKEGGRGSTTGAVSQRLRHVFIVAELALSLILLNGAGLLLKSFLRLQEVDGGFRPDHVLTMRVSLPQTKYSKPEQIRAFFNDVLVRVARLPGVESVGAIDGLPLSGSGFSGTTTIDTTAVSPDARTPETDYRAATPGYFKAMGIELISGRYFQDSDNDQSAPVTIVDESLAKTYWPNEDAVGKRLRLGGMKSTRPWMTVVGVVRHVRYRTLEEHSRVELYWSEAQNPDPSMSLVIRTTSDPLTLAPAMQKVVQSVDPEQPVFRVRTMEGLLESSMARRRLSMLLLSIFAGAALILAAIGIYGIMSYWVSQRSHEMGIRMALGASRLDVLRLVLRQSLMMTGFGVGLGLVGSLLLTRFMTSLLFNVKPADAVTFLSVVVMLASVAILASFIPARRATRVEPMTALRYE
jgi:putative ABC transport system permease protein